jgi:hypothetical protein
MLLHSREGSGERRPVDINAVVEESLNLAYHGARAEKQGFTITFERSLDPAAGAADVYPQDITRALLNLISNGFYASTTQNGSQWRRPRADPDCGKGLNILSFTAGAIPVPFVADPDFRSSVKFTEIRVILPRSAVV